MKFTKYLLAGLVLIITIVTASVLTSVSEIAVMESDGHAVSASATVKQSLIKGEDVIQPMEVVHADDVIYQNALGYYVGANRTAIDRNYPIYINGGETLKFLDENSILVSNDLFLLSTYNGLYLNNGRTYNANLSQADPDEWILLALKNGLYMTTQSTEFTNLLGTYSIPIGSIVVFSDTCIRYYRFDDGYLYYEEINSVTDSKITIGSNVYEYETLLKALSLISEKAEKPGKNIEKELEEIIQGELTDREKVPAEIEIPELEDNEEEQGGIIIPSNEPVISDEEVFYLSEVADAERSGGTAGKEDIREVTPTNQDIPPTNKTNKAADDEDISDEDRTTEVSGGDIPSTDTHSGRSSGKTGGGSGTSGGGTKREYKTPDITLSEYETWAYAIKAKLNYNDPGMELTTSVAVAVYDIANPQGIPTTDSQGHNVYSRLLNEVSVKDRLWRYTYNEGSVIMASPFKPGSKVYVQLSYTYYTDSTETTTAVYYSDFTEITLKNLSECVIPSVKASWNVERDDSSLYSSFAFKKLKIVNTTDYDPKKVETFADFQKNALPYISTIKVTLQNLSDLTEDPIVTEVPTGKVGYAKTGEIDFVSSNILKSGTFYSYKVTGMDAYGNEFPMVVETDETAGATISSSQFIGKLFTWKSVPRVTVRYDKLTQTSAETTVSVIDEDQIFDKTKKLKVYLTDSNEKPVTFSYTLDKDPEKTNVAYAEVPSDPSKEHKLTITGLKKGEVYTLRIFGTYDPSLPGTAAQIVEDGLILSQDFATARDSSDYYIPTVRVEIDEPGKNTLKGTVSYRTNSRADAQKKTVIPSGVVITVYEGIANNPATKFTDPEGELVLISDKKKNVYSWKDKVGTHALERVSSLDIRNGATDPVYDSQDQKFIRKSEAMPTFDNLLAGSTFYLQATYSYFVLSEDGKTQKEIRVYSDIIEMQTKDGGLTLDPILMDLTQVFAYDEQKISFKNIMLNEEVSGKADVSALRYLLDRIEMTFVRVGDTQQKKIVLPLSEMVINDAIVKQNGTYDSGLVKELEPDSVYTYGIKAYRFNGDELTMKVTAHEEKTGDDTVGKIYTRKQKPTAKIRTSLNAGGDVTLEVYFADKNNALIAGDDLVFSMYEKVNGVEQLVPLQGKIDGVDISKVTKDPTKIPLVTIEEHKLELTGLTVGKTYRMSVTGSYDQTPTAAQFFKNRLPVQYGELVLKDQQSIKMAQRKEPVVTLKNIKEWYYAVGVEIEVDDPSAAITKEGIKIVVEDETGKEVMTKTVSGTQEFALYPLKPGSKAFIHGEYTFEYYDDQGVKQSKKAKTAVVAAQLTPLAKDGSGIPAIRGNWDEIFAVSSSQAGFEHVKFENPAVYDADKAEFSFDNFKNNILNYLDSVEVVFTPEGDGDRVTVTIASDILEWAKLKEEQQSDVTITTKKGLLLSNKKYTYKITAKDPFGNALPLRMSVGEGKYTPYKEFKSCIYTAKQAPQVTITEDRNDIGDMELLVDVNDVDNSMISDVPFEFSVKNADGRVKLSGVFYTISAKTADGYEYPVRMSTLPCKYEAKASGADVWPEDMEEEDRTQENKLALPTVTYKVEKNENDEDELFVHFKDSESYMPQKRGQTITFEFVNENGVKVTGTAVPYAIDTTNFGPTTVTMDGRKGYKFIINNLELGENYRAEVIGSYDPQPDSKPREEGADLELVENELLASKKFVASDGSIAEPGTAIDPGEPEGVEGDSGTVYLLEPKVSMGELSSWAYAVGTTFNVYDPTASIEQGLRVYIATSITGDKKYTTNISGQKVYSGSKNTLVSSKRQSFEDTGSFEAILKGNTSLEPGKTYYFQYAYEYYETEMKLEIEPVTRRKKATFETSAKKKYTSDITEVKTLTVEEAGLADILATWNENPAAYTNTFEFKKLHFGNTANYDPNPKTVTFENFKKNTVAYLKKVKINLTELDASEKETSKKLEVVSSSIVEKAVNTLGGVTYKAATDNLTPNTHYKYTIEVIDDYGNVIPLSVQVDGAKQATSYKDYSGKIYTRKAQPAITITEKDNTSGIISFDIVVKDTYQSLVKDTLYLTVVDSTTLTTRAKLGGTVNGETIKSEDPSVTEVTEVKLAYRDDGTYHVTLNTLDFSTSYAIVLLGTCDPQPDFYPAGVTPLEKEDLDFAPYYFTTVAMTSGIIYFNVDVPDDTLLSNSANVRVTMNDKSTNAVLDLVSYYDINVNTLFGSKAATARLYRDSDPDKGITGLKDIAVSGAVKEYLVHEEPGIKVYVTGTPREDDLNLWQAIRGKWDSEGQYQMPMTIRMEITGDRLTSMTDYKVDVVSTVVRPNGSREITTTEISPSFTTKRKDPVLKYTEFYRVASIAEMTEVYIEDVDETISGAVTATLVDVTNNSTVVAIETIPVAKGSKTVTPVDLKFKDLVVGHIYHLTFTTDYYNNRKSGGVLSTHTIKPSPFSFEAANDVGGDLNLESLDYEYKIVSKKSFRNISAEEAATLIENKQNPFPTYAYQTTYLDLKVDADGKAIEVPGAITVDTTLPERWIGWDYSYYQVFYYNEQKKEISSNYHQITYKGGTTFVVPSGARYMIITMNSNYSFAEHGLQLGYYEKSTRITYADSSDATFKAGGYCYNYKINTKTGLYESASNWSTIYKVPVSEGENYVIRNNNDGGYNYNYGTTSHFFYYDANGKLINTVDTTARSNYIVTVPKKAKYMSVDYNGNLSAAEGWYGVYKIEGSTSGNMDKFAASVRVQVDDPTGYLAKKGTAKAVIKLEELDSIRQPSDEDAGRTKLRKTEEITLTKVGDVWTFDEYRIFDGLEGEKNWQVSLYVKCKIGAGEEEQDYVDVPLDVITFQTDAAYELIHNRMEMRKVWQNPYGHFLVVNDFACNGSSGSMYLYGTIDFQGHVITANTDEPLFETIYPGGVMKNLVYSYPANTEATRRNNRPVVTYNYGTMDNIIIRTEGEYWKYPENYNYGFLCYYNYGLVSNFIFEMGGDFHMVRVPEKSSPYANIFMYCNYGIIENFYMFGKNNSKLYVGVQEDPEGRENYDLTTTLVRWQHGIIRNGYTQFETVIYSPNITGSTNFWLFGNDNYSDNISNFYHVGDYTTIDTKKKSTTTRKERIFYSTTNGTVSNVWHLTKVNYNEMQARILYASTGNVQSLEWQQGVLNDAFSIEESLHVGYYPRLKLNECMKQHQAYNPLPSKAISTEPEYLGSALVRYEGQTATSSPDNWDYSSGLIRLYFNNPLSTYIETIEIANLTVEKIQAQNMNYTTGQYEVDVLVKVDESRATDAYRSKYSIESFEYGNGVKVDVGVESDGFSFWKRIAEPDQWYTISDHMEWNYRLTHDLDFGPLQYSSAQIQVRNGDKNFTGCLDGGGHTVSNIKLNGVDYPSIFYKLSSAGVKNITFDNVQIKSITYPSYDKAGIIAYAARSIIDNVHVKNSTFEAVGYVGAVVGYMDTYCSLYNCSSVNNVLKDYKTDKNTFYGGIIGGAYQSVILSCYSRNISISMNECTNIGGAGGIIGRCQGTTIQDGYATGSITGNAYNVGGIVGNFIDNQFCHFESLWSRVTIDVTGDYVGGFAGRTSASGSGILSLGNIYCIGSHVHRNIGYSRISAMKTTLTALASQNVPGLTSTDKDDCKYLLTGEELSNWSVWADKVLLDENWDLKECWNEQTQQYESLTYFPRVYKYPAEYDSTGKRVLVGDQAANGIYLPGKGGEQELSIDIGTFYEQGVIDEFDAYVTDALLNHPSTATGGFDIEKFYNAVKAGRVYKDSNKTVQVKPEEVIGIIGMDMTGEKGATVKVSFNRTGTDNTTIHIENKGKIKNAIYPYNMAKDLYRLSVNYWLPDDNDPVRQQEKEALLNGDEPFSIADWKTANLIADVTYTDDVTKEQKISYWEVPSYNEWRRLIMTDKHGKTQENFLITAAIDFNGKFGAENAGEEETFRNLQFGRLDGAKADCSCGLTNVTYTTNNVGDPWIASVTYSMENLLLENITGNLINSEMTKDRDRNAVIFATRDITNCYFHNIRTNVSNRTRTSSGFILLCYGEMKNNKIEGVYYDATRVTSTYNYASGFVCWPQGNITNNTCSAINVQAPLASYVGGLFVSVNDRVMASQTPISEVLVSENHFYGGAVAANNNGTTDTEDDIAARTESYVRGNNYAGFVSSYIYENATNNVIGRSEDTFTVEANVGTGGFAYQMRPYVLDASSEPGVCDNTIRNGSVISLSLVDGYTGGMFGYMYLNGRNAKNNMADGMYVNGNYLVGGMFGNVEHAYLYRNTVINSNIYSSRELGGSKTTAIGFGGMFGQYNSALHVRGSVVRNTKVTGPRNVGGLVGREANYSNSDYYECSYSYIAEDVSVTGTDPVESNAGGLIGYSEKAYARYNAVGATVTAAGNNAGGIIGKLMQTSGSYCVVAFSYYVGSVTGRDYVGGIIGYNRNYVPYTVKEGGEVVTKYAVVRFRTAGSYTYYDYKNRSTMNGVTVAGTFVSTGTTEDMDHPDEERQHVSAWFNNQTDTAVSGGDDIRVQIWDQCVLNGKVIDSSEKLFPQSKWISSGGFREKANFTDVSAGNLGSTYFNYDESRGVLSTYMPYTQYHEDSTQIAVQPYAEYKVIGDTPETSVRGGIQLPDYGTNPDAVQVYAVGASTVNVEVSTHEEPDPDPTPDHHLPADYQEVLYITNDGYSYINTGYSGNDNDLMVDCKFTNVPSNGNYLFGQEQISSYTHNGLYNYNSLEYGYRGLGYTAANSITMFQRKVDDSNIAITINNNSHYVAIAENKSTMPMLIFGCWGNNKAFRRYTSAVNCHYFTLKTGDTVIRELIPCYKKSDEVVGMYDLKTGEFLTNANTTGKFTAGPKIGTANAPTVNTAATEVYVIFGDVTGEKTAKKNGQKYSLTNGVVSLSYDFQTNIAVSTDDINYTTFTPDELRRTVTLNDRQDSLGNHEGDIWYYITTESGGTTKLNYGVLESTLQPAYTLPEDYVHVEYIEASSAVAYQYINTGIKGSQKIEYKIQFTQTNERQLMGMWGSVDAYWGNNNGYYEGGGTKSAVPVNTTGPDTVLWDYTVKGKHMLSVNGALIIDKNASTNTSTEGYEAQIFALNNGWRCSAKLYECKVWKDGTLVRWFVPVKKLVKEGDVITDTIPGLYDVLATGDAKKFYENANTTAASKRFVAGEEEPIPTTRAAVSGTMDGLGGQPLNVWSETAADGSGELHVLVNTGSGIVEKKVTPFYDGSKLTFTYDKVADVTSGTKLASPKPFLKQRVTITDEATKASTEYEMEDYLTFHTLTKDATPTLAEGRLYMDGNIRYTVLPSQSLVYDKVIVDDRGITGEYIAVLAENGTLTASFDIAGMKTYDVKEISNSFTSYDPYIVVLRKDGSLVVADYVNNEIIFETRNKAGFLNYVKDLFTSLTESSAELTTSSAESDSSLSNSTDSTGSEKKEIPALLSYTKLNAKGLTITTETIPSTLTTLSTAALSTAAGEGETIELNSGEFKEFKGEAPETAEAGKAATAADVTDGEASEEKKSDTKDSKSAATTEDAQKGDVPEAAVSEEAVEETETNKEEVNEFKGIRESGNNGEDETAPVASAIYVPGEGIIDLEGNQIVDESRILYVAGEGVYVDGELEYEESLFSDDTSLATAVMEEAEETAKNAEEGEKKGSETDIRAEEKEEENLTQGGVKKDDKTAAAEKTTGGNAKTPGTHVSENTASEKKSGETAEAAEKNEDANEGKSTSVPTGTNGAGGADGAGGEAGEGGEVKDAAGEVVPILLVSKAEKQKQISAAFGETTKIMNTATGEVEEYDTESMLKGKKVTTKEKKAREANKKEKEAKLLAQAEEAAVEEAVVKPATKFVAAGGMNRILDKEEGNGMILILVMGVMALAAFGGVYVAVIRKKRERLTLRGRRKGEENSRENSGEEDNR